MPFKSKAQRRLFYAKVRKGEMSMDTLRDWERETKHKKRLPEYVEKQARDLRPLAAMIIPGLSGMAVGAAGGYYAKKKGIGKRKPTLTKRAFAEEAAAILAQRSSNISTVSAALDAELEKIAFLAPLAGFLGRGIGSAGRLAGAGLGRIRGGAGTTRRMFENAADAFDAYRARVGREFRAGLQGVSPEDIMKQDALAVANAAKARRAAAAAPTGSTAAAATPPVTVPTVTPAAAATPPVAVPNVTPAAATPAAGAATSPGFLQSNFGVNTDALKARFGEGGAGFTGSQEALGNWWSGLSGVQQRNVMGAMGAGALGTGLAAGGLGGYMMGPDNRTTVVYR